jgi:hypothetical protein
MTLLDPTGAPDAVRFSALRSTAEISVEAANPHRGSSRAKGLRCQACLSGEVVTKLQSNSSRTDSPVRILYAQPASAVSAVSTAHVEEPARSRISGPTSVPPSGYFLDKGLLCDALHISGEALRPYRRCRFH